MTALIVIGAVFLGLAGVVHLYIFFLQSISWTTPTAWRRFAVRDQEEAEVLRRMAYNQGFYNGLLAVEVFAGIILLASPGLQQAAVALELFGGVSMVLAATVLVLSTPRLARAAVLQGALPLVGVATTAVGVLAA